MSVNTIDQYKKKSFNLFKELKLILKKYILYPIFGLERVQRFSCTRNKSMPGRLCIKAFSIPDYENVYYLVMVKVACSSIRKAILHEEKKDLEELNKLYLQRHIPLDYIQNIYDSSFFTFVRNPFTRIVSCYTDRVLRINDYRYFYDGRLAVSKVVDFKDFVKKIACISDDISDEHFCSQNYLLTIKDGKDIPNCYIGHFETLAEDFEPLRKKYGFAPLEQVNKSSDDKTDWRDYYDEETAKLVYDRYREDFERFGYEEEYQKLLSYLKDKREQAE